jgi:uncharacterized protein YukE
MTEKIKLNYPQMQEMATHLRKVKERLEQTNEFARSIANEMTSGALVGDVGEAFADNLNRRFITGVKLFATKFEEIAKDIDQAISDMQSADSNAGNQF